ATIPAAAPSVAAIQTPAQPTAGGDHNLKALRRRCVEKVEAKLQLKPGQSAKKEDVTREFDAACAADVGEGARGELLTFVINELSGSGPIQPLLSDPTVSEVMVNRADRVYVERKGKPVRTEIVFDDDAHVRRIIDRIIIPLGRRIDKYTPTVDARLP